MTKCTMCDTNKTVTYGLPGGKPAFCKKHADEAGLQYVDVAHKQCVEFDCPKRPSSSK